MKIVRALAYPVNRLCSTQTRAYSPLTPLRSLERLVRLEGGATPPAALKNICARILDGELSAARIKQLQPFVLSRVQAELGLDEKDLSGNEALSSKLCVIAQFSDDPQALAHLCRNPNYYEHHEPVCIAAALNKKTAWLDALGVLVSFPVETYRDHSDMAAVALDRSDLNARAVKYGLHSARLAEKILKLHPQEHETMETTLYKENRALWTCLSSYRSQRRPGPR